MAGQPVIRGTRPTVRFLVTLIEEGWSTDEILRNSPQLTPHDLKCALEY